MRTTALLVILLLALGLSLGSAPALAEDQAVVQPLPAACQPVNDAELAQLNGKFLNFNNINWRQVALCVYQKLPLSEDTRSTIRCAYQTCQTFRSCFNHTNNTSNGTTVTPP